MLNLAPWYYRNLLGENKILLSPLFFEITLLNGQTQIEAVISLKGNLKPSWLSISDIYRNCDGSGTDTHKNISIYKAISEALERWAFYELVDTKNNQFAFDADPTTNGMAAFPHFNASRARKGAQTEAIERWAIHEFNRYHLPISKHHSLIEDLEHYEIITPFSDFKVSLLSYKKDSFYVYGFAGGTTLNQSFEKALVELDRNIRVLNPIYQKGIQDSSFLETVDKSLIFFSKAEGHNVFKEKIAKAPKMIFNPNPKIICDQELKGPWSQYTKVWRYLLEDSYFDTRKDINFFMF